jgi:hypothetical protein
MKQAWNEIKNRNWNDNKINGVTKWQDLEMNVRH